MPRIQIKRGLKANLPTSSMLAGEQFFTTDRNTLHTAIDATTTKAVVPPIDDLTAIGAVDSVSDLLLIHDASGTGVKEKKITIADFKTALNISSSDTDEKVAVISGGTAGYVWGTDGTDGVIRLNTSLSWTKDSGNGYVTIAVNTVDCGTF
jgi:hypothetical protein